MHSSIVFIIYHVLAFFTFEVKASPIELLKRQAIQTSYDFVIVGGGTAGLALAARLSENGTQSVLVLEAGQLPSAVFAYDNPGYDLFLGGTVIDWYFVTPPQKTLSGRALPYHRGRCLGGSSSTNGAAYVRGSASIFDLWQALGNEGWSWDNVYPLFVKSTSFAPTTSNNDSYTTHDPSAYSNGPIKVGFAGFKADTSVAFIEACTAAGIPMVGELNNGSTIGVKQGTGTVDSNFQRSGSYSGYYMQAQNRANLDVLDLAPVHQIMLQEDSSLKATGVVFEDQTTGALLNVSATKEVILSAGAFQSPQLLMLSGIGPAQTLKENGISPYLINENVGQNLQDTPLFSLNIRTEAAVSLSEVYNNFNNLYNEEVAWEIHRSGRMTSPSGITNGFLQLSVAELQSLSATDLLQTRANQSHLELVWTSSFYPNIPTPQYTPLLNESYNAVSVSILAPTSRGNVSIQSSNPYDSPVIHLNVTMIPHPCPEEYVPDDTEQYFGTEVDQALGIEGFKRARTIVASPALQEYTIGPFNGEVSPGPSVQTDDDILRFIQNTTIPNWHVCGTLSMLPQDKGGVVDSRLRVYGVEGLRVVDTSIFPVIPDANTIATTYMVAEKAALLIAEDYNLY